VGQARYGFQQKNHATRRAVKIFTERLVETNTAGHAMPDGGSKKRGGKKDKAENRTRPGLERMLNGNVAGHSLDGKCPRL
jgi:hypothetical protein